MSRRLGFILIILTFSLIFITPVNSSCGPCKNGSCHVGKCECRFSWIGEACDIYIFSSISSTYDFFRFFFLAVGIILFGVTLTITIHALKGKAAYYHLIGFILTLFDCVVQIIVYGSGVEIIEGTAASYIASFITVLHFGLIYFVYSVYLLWWVEMNDKYKRMKYNMSKKSTRGISTSSGSKNSNNSATLHSASTASSGSNVSNDTGPYASNVNDDTASTSNVSISINTKTDSPALDVGKTSRASIGSEDSSATDLEKGAGQKLSKGDQQDNKEISQYWFKIIPKDISGKTLKWILWIVCAIVNICNVLRVANNAIDITSYVTVGLYVGASVLGWIFVLVGFHLYKRSFEKKLQMSRKNEIYAGLKKITKITLIITLILLVFGVISTIQTTFSSVALRMTAYAIRGLVTYSTIGLYIFCFGGHVASQIWNKLVVKSKAVVSNTLTNTK